MTTTRFATWLQIEGGSLSPEHAISTMLSPEGFSEQAIEAAQAAYRASIDQVADRYDLALIGDEFVCDIEGPEISADELREDIVGIDMDAAIDAASAVDAPAAELAAAATAYETARDERRRLVVEAVRAGMSKVRVSELSGVSRPTIDKWLG